MDLSPYWKTIVDTLQDGVMVVDPSGRVLAVNPAAERLTGYSEAELVGKSCRILDCTGCHIIGEGPGERWCGLYAKGEVRAKKCFITNKAHNPVNVIKNARVLRDDNGEIIGAVETLTDMSEIVRQQQEINALKRTLNLDEDFQGIVGQAPAMQRLFELIDNVAQTLAPVMIRGESGTGKELVARAIHERSRRRKQPFIKVNCAALNENLLESELFGHAKGAYTGADRARMGRFQAAHGGTIFLDEIGDIPPQTQVKLLRVLEEKEIERVGENRSISVDVRVITATNRDLESLIAQGRFREDLYFRINVFPLGVPALRERREDVPIIVQHFLRLNNSKTGKRILGLTPEAMERMSAYDWPGNVRELRNAIEYAFVLCHSGAISSQHLPPKVVYDNQCAPVPLAVSDPPPAQATVDQKQALLAALRKAGGNQSAAARMLGVSRVTVWKRMKKWGIDPKQGYG
ncbi:MAG: sigma 54-interacting transcriptional regulator [Desulfosarcinaceae bacterium]|nr:sigma 54-interacting transcriptional regulator [Desulfosarcinaceae bacterium]